MTRRMGDLLAQRAAEGLIGRTAEMAILQHLLEGDSPLVVHVHGLAGIGKSTLLDAFAAHARTHGLTVVQLDCQTIEPTEHGLLQALGAALGRAISTVDEAATRLAAVGWRVLLLFDTYDVWRLLDTWLRQVFIPALHDNVRLVLAGRQPAAPAWRTTPAWQGWFRSLPLGPLPPAEAGALLARAGLDAATAGRINRVARGHPLALQLAAATIRERPDLDLDQATLPHVVHELTHLYLAGIDDAQTRQTLDAAAVVRRVTQSLLGALLPHAVPQDAYERLRVLPFVESRTDGLVVHEAVREAIAGRLRSADPLRYRAYRRAAWRHWQTEAGTVHLADSWRLTADIIYLLDNPHIREAFFPCEAPPYTLEPAQAADGPALLALTARHDGPEATQLCHLWWEHAPEAFQVVRDHAHTVVGYYCRCDPATLPPAVAHIDPMVRAWERHLHQARLPKSQSVLCVRRWLSRDHGEQPSAVQSACWLDCKRTYLERRPHLRRVYVTVCDLETYAPATQQLGFRPVPEATTVLDGVRYHSALLDFGPASVDGWLAGLVAAELGIDDEDLLDRYARELVLDGERIRLTELECNVLSYLMQHASRAVSRVELLEHVWGYTYTGSSNVVDVVVRAVRKKLRARASMIATLRGRGYRFVALPP